MSNVVINPSALEPLFMPWEEPNAHRVRAEKRDEPAKRVQGRRTSKITIAHNLREHVAIHRRVITSSSCDLQTLRLALNEHR